MKLQLPDPFFCPIEPSPDLEQSTGQQSNGSNFWTGNNGLVSSAILPGSNLPLLLRSLAALRWQQANSQVDNFLMDGPYVMQYPKESVTGLNLFFPTQVSFMSSDEQKDGSNDNKLSSFNKPSQMQHPNPSMASPAGSTSFQREAAQFNLAHPMPMMQNDFDRQAHKSFGRQDASSLANFRTSALRTGDKQDKQALAPTLGSLSGEAVPKVSQQFGGDGSGESSVMRDGSVSSCNGEGDEDTENQTLLWNDFLIKDLEQHLAFIEYIRNSD